LVNAKLEGGKTLEPPAAQDSSGEVLDLLAALQRSVERAKVARGEAASGETSRSEAG